MFTVNIRKRYLGLVAVVLGIGLVASACSNDSPSANSQKKGDAVVEQYIAAANAAVPYPLAEMQKGGWLELRLLRENLLRQNDPHRIAYVTLLNTAGQPIVQYTIQGMVFDLNSQMTPTDKVAQYCNEHCDHLVTASPGDNGTYGPEPHAIGFFTTEGVEIKWNGLYLESDSPQNITTKPLIVYDASTAKPSTSAGGVGSTSNGGIKTGG